MLPQYKYYVFIINLLLCVSIENKKMYNEIFFQVQNYVFFKDNYINFNKYIDNSIPSFKFYN